MEKAPLGPRPTPSAVRHAPLSRQRLSVLEYVRANAPVRVADTAAGLGLHSNTVREHLDALVESELVDRTTEKPRRRGRPAAMYRPSPADPVASARDYAGLATALAGHIARASAHPERDARAAGAAWGRELIGESTDSDGDSHRVVLDALTRLGFAPDADVQADSTGIALRRCPLLDAARRYPVVVCQVHLGIVEGMLERLGAATRPGLDLVAFAEPGACRLFLPDPAVRPRP